MDIQLDTKKEWIDKKISLLDATIEIYHKLSDPVLSEHIVFEFNNRSDSDHTSDSLKEELLTYIKNNLVIVDLCNDKYAALLNRLLNQPPNEKTEKYVFLVDARNEEFL